MTGITNTPDPRVTTARRAFTYRGASVKLSITRVDQNKPFDRADLAIFEQQIAHVIEAARDLAEAEEQARKAIAA